MNYFPKPFYQKPGENETSLPENIDYDALLKAVREIDNPSPEELAKREKFRKWLDDSTRITQKDLDLILR